MDEKKNLVIEQVSGEIDINEDQAYDTLLLLDNGCLNIGGLPDPGVTEITISIKELQIAKADRSGACELKFTSPRDRSLSIKVEIGDLQGDLKTLSYAPDGRPGKAGSKGGDGADSSFGRGGKGGDGSDGEDGQDGISCPDVLICYDTMNKSVIRHQTIRSKGGAGGDGGQGGSGGLGADGTRAAYGAKGAKGRMGRPGGAGSLVIRKEQKDD